MPYRDRAIDQSCFVHPAAPAIDQCARCSRNICLVCLSSLRLQSYCAPCATSLRSRDTAARIGLRGTIATIVLVAGAFLARYIRTPPLRLVSAAALPANATPLDKPRRDMRLTDDEKREVAKLETRLRALGVGQPENRELFLRLLHFAKRMSCVERLGPPPRRILDANSDVPVTHKSPTTFAVLHAYCIEAENDPTTREDILNECDGLSDSLGCMM